MFVVGTSSCSLDAVLRLVAAWKLFDDFKNTTWRIPTDCPPDGNNIPDLEFVGQHRCSVGGRDY